MTAQPVLLSTPVYSEADHNTWAELNKRQMPRVGGRACRLFLEGFTRLKLDPVRLPDPNVYSERLRTMTGWTQWGGNGGHTK